MYENNNNTCTDGNGNNQWTILECIENIYEWIYTFKNHTSIFYNGYLYLTWTVINILTLEKCSDF